MSPILKDNKKGDGTGWGWCVIQKKCNLVVINWSRDAVATNNWEIDKRLMKWNALFVDYIIYNNPFYLIFIKKI